VSADLAAFVREKLGHDARSLELFERALTHPSFGRDNYQRLEFLGDRVLGLVMAEWLSERFPKEPEGQLSHRFTTLVSRAKCARVASEIGVADHLRMGKQAWQEGVSQSENVLGDTTEALIAALYLEGGLEEAKRFIHEQWTGFVESQGATAPRHPKSLLIEWAEGRGHKPPIYEVTDRSGPGHSLEFTVRVTVKGVGDAEGIGSSKQEAETAAAQALLEQLK
jgi:ribonuclease-3